jgi:hypothetical protein
MSTGERFSDEAPGEGNVKRFTAIAAVCAVGLVAPATVGAATKEYTGTIAGGGSVGFKIKSGQNGSKVKGFGFATFPVGCTGGPNTASGHVTFAPKVKNRKFEIHAVAGDPNHPDARLDVTGKLKSGGNVEGTIKVEGKNLEVDNPPDSHANCESEKADWTAST